MDKLILLDPIQAQVEWPNAAPALRRAVLHGEPDLELRTLRIRVANGLTQLWKVVDEKGKVSAWATTYLYSSNQNQQTAQITMAAADNAEDFLEMLAPFEEWAKLQGVEVIEVIGREGWKKLLRPHGFSHNYTSFTKEVYKELH